MKLLVKTTAPADPFYRLGRAFTKEGVIVARDEFTEAEWAIIVAEPLLHIGPAPEGVAEAAAASDLAERIRVVIAELDQADFAEDGSPKPEAVRARLPGMTGVTKKAVAEVWAALKPAS